MKSKKAVQFINVFLSIFLISNLQAETKLEEKTEMSNKAVVAKEWRSYVEPLIPLGSAMTGLIPDPADPLLRHEMYSQLFHRISTAYMGGFFDDSRHPEFWPFANKVYNLACPNPDTVYYLASLSGEGVYRLSGFRGTVHMVDVQIGGGGFYPRGEGPYPPTYHTYDVDTLNFGENGSFEVILSAERPEGYKGDWWQIDRRSTYVMIRQVAYDWINEVDGRYAIDRLDTHPGKPRRSVEEIDDLLKGIPQWAENITTLVTDEVLNNFKKDGLVNKLRIRATDEMGGYDKNVQVYVEGLFDIEADEALIYETEVPEQCRYWQANLTDMLWNTIDWTNRQSSINGFTARLDSDGKFRAVISKEDPGVANWLDTGGYLEGVIYGRWNRCSSTPTPTLTKVKLKDLKSHLPKDTAFVTEEERIEALRLRRTGVQLRRRW